MEGGYTDAAELYDSLHREGGPPDRVSFGGDTREVFYLHADTAHTAEAAATRVQSAYRGHRTRVAYHRDKARREQLVAQEVERLRNAPPEAGARRVRPRVSPGRRRAPGRSPSTQPPVAPSPPPPPPPAFGGAAGGARSSGGSNGGGEVQRGALLRELRRSAAARARASTQAEQAAAITLQAATRGRRGRREAKARRRKAELSRTRARLATIGGAGRPGGDDGSPWPFDAWEDSVSLERFIVEPNDGSFTAAAC